LARGGELGEIAASIVAGWITLSVLFVVAWARFMNHVARKEWEIAHAAGTVSPVLLETYPRAA
jgi:hypothetical protein